MLPGGHFVLHTPNLWYPCIFAASLLPSTLVRRIAGWADGRAAEEIFPTYYRMNTKASIEALSAFRPVEIHALETAPVLAKLPVAGAFERMLIRLARREAFESLRADWIAVLEKAGSPAR